MEGGYPTLADIIDYLTAEGIEEITLGNPNYRPEALQQIWALLNRACWAGSLGVWCPTPVTFNVRGGKYIFRGTIKTYTPGNNVDPTNNDTTYIWLKPDNTIGSGIDGSGWPATEHIKLAEIDVDSDGVITTVRDLRGETFLNYSGIFNDLADATIGVPLVIREQAAGATVQIFNANCPRKILIIDAWLICSAAHANGTVKLTDGTNDITDAMICAVDKTIVRAGTIDDTYSTIAANGSLSLVPANTGTGEVFILCIPIV